MSVPETLLFEDDKTMWMLEISIIMLQLFQYNFLLAV